MILCGERVARDVDRLDRRLRRQPAALEAVDADDRIPAGHVLQLLRHLVGIVRQRVDLLARHRGAERGPPVRRRFSRVADDGHRVLNTLERQHDDVLVVPRFELDVLQEPRLEAGELRVDGVAPRREPLQSGDALFAGLDRRHRRLRTVDGVTVTVAFWMTAPV